MEQKKYKYTICNFALPDWMKHFIQEQAIQSKMTVSEWMRNLIKKEVQQ